MKRAHHLYESIYCPENLRLAFLKASRGKQKRSEVFEFREHFEKNIQKLHLQLQQNTPDIGNYHFFHVQDPKKRLICAASFQERVLHHAIMTVCEPVLERYAIYDSYACRKGKGLRRAVRRAQHYCRQNSWYLKMDISKYFDSIDHQIMYGLLSTRIKEKRLLNLFSVILDTYHTEPGKGMPIGNLISQHLANFYLGCLDHWLKEERGVKGYLRYMDDFVLFGSNKNALKQEFVHLERYLHSRLSLQIKDDWSLNRCNNGIPFLGFRIFPGRIMLGKRSKQRFREKLLHYEWLCASGLWSEEELSRHITPLVEFTKNADTVRRFRQVFF
jgi:retron-type reverse transcriptase